MSSEEYGRGSGCGEYAFTKMYFQGKIDGWFYAVAAGINVLEIGILWACRDTAAAMAIILIALAGVDLLILPMLTRNYTELTETSVQVTFGFIKTEIPYYDISQFYPTHNPLSSLAASLDRIYIGGRMSADVFIAVKEKEKFLKELEIRTGIKPGKKAV